MQRPGRQQVVVTKERTAHVPMEVLGLQVESEDVSQHYIQSGRNCFGVLQRERWGEFQRFGHDYLLEALGILLLKRALSRDWRMDLRDVATRKFDNGR